MTEKKKGIGWEYCECGCKGFTAKLGDINYWTCDNLKGEYWLVEGHGHTLGRDMGKYASQEEVDDAVRDDAKPRLKKLRTSLDDAEARM